MILEGKTVTVVGVGDGLGSEVARLALRDGARVMLAARTPERLERTAQALDPSGERVAWQATDITDPAQCAALARATAERLGPPDALACVAALDASFGDLRSTAAEEWRRTHEINVIGTTQVVRAFADQMGGRGGAVVLIGSQSSLLPPRPPAGAQIAYASSKGALLTAMYCMARELGPEHIRVNTVVPTWMWGPPVEGYVKAQAGERGVSIETVLAEILQPMAIKEMPADEDVAEAVVFLCSDRARTITGQTLLVNSGEHMP